MKPFANRLSAAIEAVATDYGYPINTEFGGHGLGRTMHEDPHVPNKGRAGRGLTLRAGMTLALEPWFARTTDRIVFDPDGWTIRSADGSRTAHSEHTITSPKTAPWCSPNAFRTRRTRPRRELGSLAEIGDCRARFPTPESLASLAGVYEHARTRRGCRARTTTRGETFLRPARSPAGATHADDVLHTVDQPDQLSVVSFPQARSGLALQLQDPGTRRRQRGPAVGGE